MERNRNLYEPVISFQEQRSQMQIEPKEHHALYEKAFFSGEDKCTTEYAQNTTTWD